MEPPYFDHSHLSSFCDEFNLYWPIETTYAFGVFDSASKIGAPPEPRCMSWLVSRPSGKLYTIGAGS